MNGILKDELGFQGFVQSDWLAQRSGVASALAGLDMSMPGDGLRWEDGTALWGGELTKAVLNTSIPVERINDMTLRIVAAWYQLGQDDKTTWPEIEDGGGPNFSSWTDEEIGKLHPGSDDETTGVVNKFINVQSNHSALARQIGAEGIVLVKNENNTLPLSRDGKPIASGDRKLKIGIFGEDAYSNPEGPNACGDRACNVGTLAMGWGSGAVEFPYLVAPADALHANFDHNSVDITDVHTNEQYEQASDQDVCMVFISADAGEGYVSWNGIKGDRNDLYANKKGDELVQKVASRCGGDGNGPTIVVYHTVGPVILEKWIDIPNIKAVLIAHLPGEESGNALTDVLFGDVNPSGRLPYTIAKREEDYGPTSKILYTPNAVVPQQNFTEGLYTDYRYFDKQSITPRYEFGYGLSYTTFHLSSLFIHPLSTTRTALPSPRPQGILPPSLDIQIPDPKTALWPSGIKKLKKYIYPYITSLNEIKQGKYPYPPGYTQTRPPSPAGGAQGGNPSLFETLVVIQASLTNLGDRPGSCVVQCYISFPTDLVDSLGNKVDTPVRALRQFDKLAVGTSNEKKRAKVEFELTRKDLSFWDTGLQQWVLPETGEFEVGLGYSSRDIEVVGRF
ncbi:glycosyl hydrolase family 3 C-terminal domain-containing protein [Delphinella strobiligena]|nr:glycosyl hydrolase family 3 C-terminal domain-containing protein [Delphinella strobiligena]